MLERRGVETTIHTLAGIQSTQTCLFATSASAYYRMQTEQSTDGIAMPLTHKTVKTKYGAIQTVSGLLNTSTKQLESEYMRHHDSVMMLPQFHAYLLEKLGPPTPTKYSPLVGVKPQRPPEYCTPEPNKVIGND